MRPSLFIGAVLLTATTSAVAQVTVDLHALQALPERPAASRPPRPVASAEGAARARREAPERGASTAPSQQAATSPTKPEAGPATRAPAPSQTEIPAPGQRELVQPAKPELPQSVPETASINPIAPVPLPAGSPPPPPAPVSTNAGTTAAPTNAGVRLTFEPEKSDLSPDSAASIKQLVDRAAHSDSTTFNVLAYAPGKADDPSTARRMSLSRAMAVRSALVNDGVPSARIFVRALGEQYGDGPPNRVDINVSGTSDTATAR